MIARGSPSRKKSTTIPAIATLLIKGNWKNHSLHVMDYCPAFKDASHQETKSKSLKDEEKFICNGKEG